LASQDCCSVSSVVADSGLQGLEMDVMDPGENAARATSRIAMPRLMLPVPVERDLPGLEPEQQRGLSAVTEDEIGAAVAREAAPVTDSDTGNDAPGTPR
jgi:hypothetical protein